MGRRNKKKRNSSFSYFNNKDTKKIHKQRYRNYGAISSCSTNQVRDIAEQIFGDRYTYRVNSDG